MLPLVYPLLTNDSTVAGLVDGRVYRHGDAPQNVTRPYVTWFVVTGTPENTLDEVPRIDDYRVQVDCWSDGDAEVEELSEAVRNAIEPSAYMTQVHADDRDPETKRYRMGMTFTFWTDRSP